MKFICGPFAVTFPVDSKVSGLTKHSMQVPCHVWSATEDIVPRSRAHLTGHTVSEPTRNATFVRRSWWWWW